MSQQALDLRRSVQIVRRHKILVAIVVALGVLAGGAYAVLNPPMLTSTALVALTPPASQSHTASRHHRRNRSLHGDPRGDRGQRSGAVGRTAQISARLCRWINFAAMSRSEARPPISFR